MNDIQIFNNSEFGAIRTVQINGDVLFCGADIAKALGYSDTTKAIKAHCKADGWTIRPVIDSMERGLFEIKETVISHSDGHTSISKTPKVTGRGQIYFINKFMDREKRE